MLPFLRLDAVPDSRQAATTVVLADDHAVMRASLRTLLDGEADIDVIAETDKPQDVARYLQPRPDVLVLDLALSQNGPGLNTLAKLCAELPDMRIVILTIYDDLAFVRHALEIGALGIVLKEMADSDLPAAVRAASCGRRYVSPKLATR
jgi:DNA-binding NarL/FixJ family response regulator